MEEDSWSFGLSSASSRSNQSTLKSHPDFFIEIDDFDGDDDLRLDFPCPYCSEDFDLLGLCCHIDEEHASESKSGVCPVCATTRIGTNMVGHITTQHVNYSKHAHQKSKPQKDEFFSNLLLSRKELQDEPFRSIFGSVSPVSTSMKSIDPLLSFLHSTPRHKPYINSHLASSSEVGSLEEEEEEEEDGEEEEVEISEHKALESRDNSSPPLSGKDQEEKAERCKFLQGLVWSTIFGDY